MSVLTEKIRLSGTFRLFLSPIAGDKALTLPQPISGGLSSRFGSPAPAPRGGRKTMAYMWNNTKIIPSLPIFLLFLFFHRRFLINRSFRSIFPPQTIKSHQIVKPGAKQFCLAGDNHFPVQAYPFHHFAAFRADSLHSADKTLFGIIHIFRPPEVSAAVNPALPHILRLGGFRARLRMIGRQTFSGRQPVQRRMQPERPPKPAQPVRLLINDFQRRTHIISSVVAPYKTLFPQFFRRYIGLIVKSHFLSNQNLPPGITTRPADDRLWRSKDLSRRFRPLFGLFLFFQLFAVIPPIIGVNQTARKCKQCNCGGV